MERAELNAIRALLLREMAIWAKDKKSIFLRFILQPGIATFAFGKVISPHVSEGHGYDFVILTGIAISFVMTFCFLNIANNVMLGYNTRLFESWLCSPISIPGLITTLILGAALNGTVAGTVILIMNCLMLDYSMHNVLQSIPIIFLSAILFSIIASIIYLSPSTPIHAQGIMPYVALPMTNLGCIYYSYSMLPGDWNYLALLVPMTYASEALRAAMSSSALFGHLGIAYLLLLAACTALYFVLLKVAQRRLGEYLW
jgi:ABC-type multidrug transport system permease subunit